MKYKLAALPAHECHAAKAYTSRAALVVGLDHLVGRQRDFAAIEKEHKGSRRSVPNNGQAGGKSGFAKQPGSGNELDQKRHGVHIRQHTTIGRRSL